MIEYKLRLLFFKMETIPSGKAKRTGTKNGLLLFALCDLTGVLLLAACFPASLVPS